MAAAENLYAGKKVYISKPSFPTEKNHDEFVAEQVYNKIRQNAQNYLSVILVADSEVLQATKKIQKESSSMYFNESEMISIGKFSSAEYGLFSKILIGTNSEYSISVDFTDLEKGLVISTVLSRTFHDISNLYEESGTVDEITLLLCKNLGINLSAEQKNSLQNSKAKFNLNLEVSDISNHKSEIEGLIEEKSDYNFKLGLQFFQSKDYEKAASYLSKVKDKSDSDLNYYLGLMNLNGYGVKKNYSSAKKYLEKSAQNNNSNATYLLATMYMNGKGCKENLALAMELLETAAKNENSDAQFYLYQQYQKGGKIPKKYFQGFRLAVKGC